MMDTKNENIEFADTEEYVWKKKRAINVKKQDLFSQRLRDKIRQRMRTQSLEIPDGVVAWKIPSNHESPRNDIGLSNGFLFKSNSDEFSDSLSPRAPLAEEISFSENGSLDETYTINDRNLTFTLNGDEDTATLTPNSSLSDNENEEFRIDNIELDLIAENDESVVCVETPIPIEETTLKPTTKEESAPVATEPILLLENTECQIMNQSQEKIFSLHSSCALELEVYFQNFLIATKSDLFFLLSDFAKFVNFLISDTKITSCFLGNFSEMKYYSSHYSQLSLSLFIDKVLTKLIDVKSDESTRALLRDEKMHFIKRINRYAVENKLKSQELFELVINTISETLKHVENKKPVSDVSGMSSGCMVAVSSDVVAHIPATPHNISRLGSLVQSSCELPCEKLHFPSSYPFDHIKSTLFQFNGHLEEIKNIVENKNIPENNIPNYSEEENEFPEKIREHRSEIVPEVFQRDVEVSSQCCGDNREFSDNDNTRFVDQETQVTNVGLESSVCVNCGSVTKPPGNLFSSSNDSTPLVPCQESLLTCDVNTEQQDVINNNSCDKHADSFSEIQDLIEKGNSLIKKFNFNYLEILQTDNKLREGVEDLNLNQTFTNEKSESIFKFRNEDLKTIAENDETDSDLEPESQDMKQKKSKSEEAETMSSSEMCNGVAGAPTVKPILKYKRQASSGSLKKAKKKNHVQFNEGLNKFFDADYVILIRDDDEYDGDMIGCDCEDDYCFEDCYEEYEDYQKSHQPHSQPHGHPQQKKYDLCAAFEPPMEFVDQVTLSPPDGYKDCSPHHCFNHAEPQQSQHHQGKNQISIPTVLSLFIITFSY